MAQLWYYDDRGTADDRRRRLLLRRRRRLADEDPHRRALRQGLRLEGQRRRRHRHRPAADAGSDGTDGTTAPLLWRQWNHPSYNATTIDNDIAVITLANPVKATPIRMTTSGDTASYAAGTKATLYGWGRTSSTSAGHLRRR